MTRQETIFAIIELHNHFTKEWDKFNGNGGSLDLWNKDDVEMRFDRYYLVESVSEDQSSEYDNKKFIPKIEVRKHLRSKERKAYGDGHDAFYKGYLHTIPFNLTDLDDIEKGKKRITNALAVSYEANNEN